MCTSFIVLKTFGIQYANGSIDGVFVGVMDVIIAVCPLLLVGGLCAVIIGWVCLIQAADCCVVCNVLLLCAQGCVVVDTVDVRKRLTRDGCLMHSEWQSCMHYVNFVLQLCHMSL